MLRCEEWHISFFPCRREVNWTPEELSGVACYCDCGWVDMFARGRTRVNVLGVWMKSGASLCISERLNFPPKRLEPRFLEYGSTVFYSQDGKPRSDADTHYHAPTDYKFKVY